jgi:hypothetical protein
VYSIPGAGKTELAAAYPDALFLMTGAEEGLLTLMSSGRVSPDTMHFENPASNFGDARAAMEIVRTGDHKRTTFVIDTLNGLERLLAADILANEFDNDPAAYASYGKGDERLGKVFEQEVIAPMRRIRDERGMRIVLLCHAKIATFKNPTGEDYMHFSPELNEKHVWNKLNAWVDNVFFIHKEVLVISKKGQKSKAKDSSARRLLHVDAGPTFYAKNRFGLHDPIDMGMSGRDGFNNLMRVIKATQPKKPATEPVTKESEAA